MIHIYITVSASSAGMKWRPSLAECGFIDFDTYYIFVVYNEAIRFSTPKQGINKVALLTCHYLANSRNYMQGVQTWGPHGAI